MTTTLTPRAPTPDTRPGRTWGPHAAGKMVLGAVMILAGLFASRTVTSLGDHHLRELVRQRPSWTTPPATPARTAVGSPDGSAAMAEPEPAARGEHSWPADRLAPQTPVDGRDVADPTVVHDRLCGLSHTSRPVREADHRAANPRKHRRRGRHRRRLGGYEPGRRTLARLPRVDARRDRLRQRRRAQPALRLAHMGCQPPCGRPPAMTTTRRTRTCGPPKLPARPTSGAHPGDKRTGTERIQQR
jgi:hypothetical protein